MNNRSGPRPRSNSYAAGFGDSSRGQAVHRASGRDTKAPSLPLSDWRGSREQSTSETNQAPAAKTNRARRRLSKTPPEKYSLQREMRSAIALRFQPSRRLMISMLIVMNKLADNESTVQ